MVYGRRGEVFRRGIRRFPDNPDIAHASPSRITQMLEYMDGKTSTEISQRYPELFEERMLPVFIDLFGGGAGGEAKEISDYTLGGRLLRLTRDFEVKLSDEKFRRTLKRQGIEIEEDSAKVYVENCVKIIKDEEPEAFELYKTIGKYRYHTREDTLLEKMKEEGIKVNKFEDLLPHLELLDSLNLISFDLEEREVRLVDRYWKYIEEAIQK